MAGDNKTDSINENAGQILPRSVFFEHIPPRSIDPYKDKKWIEEEYILKQKSIRQIARETKHSRNTIKIWMKKHNILFRREDGSIITAQKIHLAENHPRWRGGQTVISGRMFILVGKEHPMANSMGYVSRSRLNISQNIGRFLESHEIVHHKNNNILDDSIDNLQLLKSQSKHAEIHCVNRRDKKTGKFR